MSDVTEHKKALEEYFNDTHAVKSEWDGRQMDWVLQWLCGFINETKMSVGITLTVGGNQITGTLIPHKTYFDRLAQDFSAPFAASGSETQDAIRTRILSFHEDGSEGGENPTPVQYLHLDNARVHTGGNQIFPGKGTLWRGKLSAVEGFILGEISQAK